MEKESFVYNEGLNICMFLRSREGSLEIAAVLKARLDGSLVFSVLLNTY